jgi:hypothetical protein
MAWRTVQKDGAIEIYGSLFYRIGSRDAPERSFPVGEKVWVQDGDHTNEIVVFAQRYDGYIGHGECAQVEDPTYGIRVPERAALTRLRQKREIARADAQEIRDAVEIIEQRMDEELAALDLPPVTVKQLQDAGMVEGQDYTVIDGRPVLIGKPPAPAEPQPEPATVGTVIFLAFDASRDAPKRHLRAEAFTFGYPVFDGGMTAQETADTMVDEIIASYESPFIKRHTQEEVAPFLNIGDDWSWDDTDRVAAATPPQQASGDDPQPVAPHPESGDRTADA